MWGRRVSPAGSWRPIIPAQPHLDTVAVKPCDEWRIMAAQEVDDLIATRQKVVRQLRMSMAADQNQHSSVRPHYRVSLAGVVSQPGIGSEYYPASLRDKRNPISIWHARLKMVQKYFQRNSILRQRIWEYPPAEILVREEGDVRRPVRSGRPPRLDTDLADSRRQFRERVPRL